MFMQQSLDKVKVIKITTKLESNKEQPNIYDIKMKKFV
ncbi:hypothetical protein J595_03510 [Acinetobacter sp. 1592897]|nr:hypothetical protein J594_4177 [Acinetobacter sp. 259052]EYT14035.1 hypothetical protein J595_03510 [Acinetobacter sp. 1592897]